MAIISHKWLIIWLKNDIFINLSWHGGCGPLLSPFEHLEVPVPHKSFITLLFRVAGPFEDFYFYFLAKCQDGRFP